MSCDEAISSAFGQILPLFPNVYTGKELRYLVYNYYVIPDVFADSVAHAARYSVQLHLYLPHKENPNPVKLSIINACLNTFTFPSMTNASDKDGQHYVFEFEFVNAGGLYGET